MELQFLGAAGTVTGSRYLLSYSKTKVLVDCGLYQGIKNLRLRNWQAFPIEPKSINAIVLTHAHIDHSGYLPVLVKQGFSGPIYATAATKKLCTILLLDSAHLQQEDAIYANKHGFSKHHPALPLFTREDALKTLNLFVACSYHKAVAINPHLTLTFTPAGHILGAACVQLKHNDLQLVFSGDLGRPNDLLMYPPEPIKEADYLIVESTYGNRRHLDNDPRLELADIVNQTFERKGTVLFPAFAVGRAQALMYILSQLKIKKLIPDIPIYLNSPMASQATELLFQYNDEHRLSPEDCRVIKTQVQQTPTTEESIKLTHKSGPLIIISASGMASGGRVLHHLKTLVSNPKNSIVFTGFQVPGTRGDAMIHGADQIKIHGDYYPIYAKVYALDNLSAHADYTELLDWLRHFKTPPRRTFITHGEPAAADAMRRVIQDELGWKAEIPAYLDKVTLEL